jgi:hypothetical protein
MTRPPLDEEACQRLLRAIYGEPPRPEPPGPEDPPAGRRNGLRLLPGGTDDGEDGDGGD